MDHSSSILFCKFIEVFSTFFFVLLIDLLPAEEATVKRLLANPTVEGIIITNEQGQLQYTSLDNNVTFPISSKLLFLSKKARETIRDLDPTDNLITFRLRTQSKEMMTVTPDDGIQIIAIQKIHSRSSIIPQAKDEFTDNS